MSTAATRAPALTSANAGGHGHVIPHIVVNTVIVFNLAVAVCSEIDRPHEELWAVVESACLVFFGLEMLVKLACQRRGFWRDRWNLFDLTVIALAALPLLVAGADLGVLRVARVARRAALAARPAVPTPTMTIYQRAGRMVVVVPHEIPTR